MKVQKHYQKNNERGLDLFKNESLSVYHWYYFFTNKFNGLHLLFVG